MRADEREDKLYTEGKRCAIALEEEYMLNMAGSAPKGKSRLLDIGCGSGEISLALQRLGYEVCGVDFSSKAIELAQEAGLECEQVDVDQGLPMADSSYDVVWAGDVMEHVFDPIGVLTEISRVLKSDGVFYATIPHDLHWKTRIKTLIGSSYQEGVYRKYRQYKHHSFFSEKLVRYMFAEAGLKIQDMFYLRIWPIIGSRSIGRSPIFRLFTNLMIIKSVKKVAN